MLDGRLDRLFRAAPAWAGQAGGGAEQPADQRALRVDLAASRPQVHAVELGQRGLVFGVTAHRQTRQFLGRRRHRPTAVMAAGYTVEARYLPAQVVDLAVCAAHARAILKRETQCTA